MSNTELFKRVWADVAREMNKNPNLSLKDTAEKYMDKRKVPISERETFLHVLSRKMRIERVSERQKPEIEETEKEPGTKQRMFSREVWEKIRKGAEDAEINYEFEKGLHDGTITKENLENSRFTFKGKEVKKLPFGPPR